MKKIFGLIKDCIVTLIIVLIVVFLYSFITDYKGTINKITSAFDNNNSIENVEVDTTKNVSIVDTAKVDTMKTNVINGSLYEIPVDIDAGCMYLTVYINGIPMKMMFDTGCSNMRMSSIEYWFLKRQGKISKDHFISEGKSVIANGSEEKVGLYKIDSVRIGNKTLYDIECVFGNTDSLQVENAPLLIGQSVFSKLGKISIDYDNKKIIIN